MHYNDFAIACFQDAFTKNPYLTNLLLDPYFCERIGASQQSLREVFCQAVMAGVPVPAFSTALAFYDGYRSAVLPANMLQVNVYLFICYLLYVNT